MSNVERFIQFRLGTQHFSGHVLTSGVLLLVSALLQSHALVTQAGGNQGSLAACSTCYAIGFLLCLFGGTVFFRTHNNTRHS